MYVSNDPWLFFEAKRCPLAKKFGKLWSRNTAFMVHEHINMGYWWNCTDSRKPKHSGGKKKPVPVPSILHQAPKKALRVWNKNGKATRSPVTQLTSTPEITPQIRPRRTVCCQTQEIVCTNRQYKPAVFKPWTSFLLSMVRKTEVVNLHTANET